MTKQDVANEILFSCIKRGKKTSFKALKNNFLPLVLCWFLTVVVTFAAWGVYVFIDFLCFFLDLPLDFLSVTVALFIAFPLYVGNIAFSKRIVKGRKADIYVLFDGYFNLRQFWLWVALSAISLSPNWLIASAVGAVSKDTARFLPFLKGDVLFYVSIVFEVATVILFFLSLCKSLYYLSLYELQSSKAETVRLIEMAEKRYLKLKKIFRRYILAHLHLIVIMILSRAFPLFFEALTFTVVLGYFALCLCSFSEGFGVRFKKYK